LGPKQLTELVPKNWKIQAQYHNMHKNEIIYYLKKLRQSFRMEMNLEDALPALS